MALKKVSFGGAYFKPADHASAFVLLVEPTHYAAQVTNNFGEVKDIAKATITVFNTHDDADPQVFTNAQIENGVLVKQIHEDIGIGEQVAVTVGKKPSKKGQPYWAFSPATPEGEALVEAYLEKRDAEDAEAEALLG